MKTNITLKFLLSGLALAACLQVSALNSKRERLDLGWKTSTGEIPQATAPDFDDFAWTEVALPHDWSIRFNPQKNANAGKEGGYLPGVKAAYRRNIDVDPAAGERYFIYIEGAYMKPEVWVNGQKAGEHYYGYTSFRTDITDFLHPGINQLTIVTDNTGQKNSRWYAGSGLYRPVWLEKTYPVDFEPWSMTVTTPKADRQKAIVNVKAEIADNSAAAASKRSYSARLSITAPDGTVVAESMKKITLPANEKKAGVSLEAKVKTPSLWSPSSPDLYTATLLLSDSDGNILTSESETFGIRTFEYDSTRGARLNGEPILINGACVHHDNGLLGAAAYDAAEMRKALLLKRAGYNALRTSHNTPSPALLDACDRIGLLVIDEAFDGWQVPKNSGDYGVVFDEKWPDDLGALIKRDRNHPSVIAWSVGNEITERKSEYAVKTSAAMAELVKELDPTRPMTQALAAWDPDWEIYDPLAANHGIIGYNYLIHKAEGDHRRVPERVIWQTESYPRDVFQNWQKVKYLPYVVGDFVWTGMEYIGESGIGRNFYEGEPAGESWQNDMWPCHNAACGDIDLIGHRKPIAHYRDILFNETDGLYLAVREPNGYFGNIKETMWSVYPTYDSWNWPGHEGQPIEVEVYTRQPKVALSLNGMPVEEKTVDESTGYKATFSLPYQAGTIEAVAYDSSGNETAREQLTTPGQPAEIRLNYQRLPNSDGSTDLIFIDADIVDANGVLNRMADCQLIFSVDPRGELLGTASADPSDAVGYTSPVRTTWKGRAGAVVKTLRGQTPMLKVESAALPAKTIILK